METIKKTKTWSKKHEADHLWLFNAYKKIYPDVIKDTFIDDNKKTLQSFIELNNAWSDASKEALLFMIARYLYIKNQNDEYSEKFSSAGFQYMIKKRIKEDNNELDTNELISFRSHDFFLKLIDKIDVSTITTKEEHMKYLLLNILVLQPPLRTSFYSSCSFIKSKKDNDNINNFILLNRRGMLKAYYIINKDKVSNYKFYNLNKNLSTIAIEDKKLLNLLNDSLIKYPRKFLFETNKGDNVSDGTLLKWLKDITGIKGLNFDIMRSSFITFFYKQNNKSFGEKTKLSNQMRHHTTTAARNYNKIIDTSPEVILNKNTELLIKLSELEKKLNDCLIKNKTVDEDSKLFKKRRSDIIYRLNKGTKPKDSTLKIYGITQDQETKVYK